MSDSFKTPEWVHHAVFYQIFPDRFAISKEVKKPNNLESWESKPTPNGYKGGDLLGIVEKLDYLQDVGINAIYLNPIFQSASNHRYHTHDYFKVDPLLGGDAALKRLLSEAHKKNIKIVLDGVFNHASRGFFQFNDILENGEGSPYVDWFDIRGYPLNPYHGKPNYRCWWNIAALPELNTDNPQVRDYIFSVAKYWVDMGIDGWRLDVPFEIKDDAFWQEFRSVVKTANPEAYITGEIPMDASRWLAGDQFDGVMNYLLTYAIWLYFGRDDADQELFGHWLSHAPGLKVDRAEAFASHVEALLSKYPRQAVLAQMNLLDSHDTARYLSILQHKKEVFLLSVLFLMTYPGAPSVYYGDEIGLDGGNDPDCRKAFPWDPQQWDPEILAFYQQCIAIRHKHTALRTGEYKTLYAKDDVIAYRLRNDAETVVVVINRSSGTRRVEISLNGDFADGSLMMEELRRSQVVVQQGKLVLELAPYSGGVYTRVK